jgi:outer membrane receptor protein involved in Fe transport
VGDARTNFFINNQTPRNVVLDSSGNTVSHDLRNGLTAKSDSFGVNAKFNLASGWNVNNNFRYSMNSGSFLAAFPLGNTNVGAGATTAAGTIPFSIMDATLDNMGNIFDDLKFSKAMSLANGAKITPTFGVFYGQQNQKYSQYFNQYAIRGIGSSAVGTLFATPNTIGGGTWGALRTDAKFYEIDPYASLHYESGALTLDGGIRSMNQRVTGTTGGLSAATGVGAGTWATPGAISYSLNKNAYSFGGNYAVSKELSVYGSLSQGYNFMPTDRLGTIANNPSPSFNQVRQYDLGVRMKSGPVNAAGTVFIAKTTESNFDVTNPALGFVTNSYSASGLETELGYRSGGFRINSALTYTNAKIDATSTMPQRQAKFVYSIMPSYSMGDVTLGGSIIGTTKSYGDDANTITLAGYTMFNAFTSYQVNKETTASLAVNNLFNTLANTEGGVGAWNNSTRAYPGRTIRASVKVNF